MSGSEQLLRFLTKEGLLGRAVRLDSFNKCALDPIEALSEDKVIDQEKVLEHLSKHLKMPAFEPSEEQSIDLSASHALLEAVGRDFSLKNKVLPLIALDGRALLLMTNPFDLDAQKLASFVAKRQFELRIIEGKRLRNLRLVIEEHGLKFDSLNSTDYAGSLEIFGETSTSFERENLNDSKEPIIRLVNKILVDGVLQGASDIHFEPMERSMSVKFRIDGCLEHAMEVPKRLQTSVVSRIKLLSRMDIAERRRPQDGGFQIRYNGNPIDLRVSALPTTFGECLVVRLLKTDLALLSLEKLAMPGNIKQALQEALLSFGKMILVTGPTGSGKTTTLYSCLNALRERKLNIVTVENPVEYRLPGVNQVQVNETAGVSFASALRSILRQDPDVIFIGEIRDLETAQIAFQAAQTGHLVLSTLHTNDAPSAITRLLDLGVKPFLLSSSLGIILSQRLVRSQCPVCSAHISDSKLNDYLSDRVLQLAGFNFDGLKEGAGCTKCNSTGYRGRIGIFGMVKVTPQLALGIHDGTNIDELVKGSDPESVIHLQKEAIRAVESGKTTIEEVRPYLSDKDGGQNSAWNGNFSRSIALVGMNENTKTRLFDFLKSEHWNPIVDRRLVPREDTRIYIFDGNIDRDQVTSFVRSLTNTKEAKEVGLICLDNSSHNGFSSFELKNFVNLPTSSSPLHILQTIESIAKNLT